MVLNDALFNACIYNNNQTHEIYIYYIYINIYKYYINIYTYILIYINIVLILYILI